MTLPSPAVQPSVSAPPVERDGGWRCEVCGRILEGIDDAAVHVDRAHNGDATLWRVEPRTRRAGQPLD